MFISFMKSDPWIIIVTICLMGFGLLGLLSAGIHIMDSPFYFFIRQLKIIGIGLCGLWIGSMIDYHRYQFKTYWFYILTIILLFIVYFKGNMSWLQVGNYNLQPSEFGKLIIIMYLSYVLSFDFDSMRFLRHSVFYMFTCFSMIIPTALQPDFGTALIMSIITLYMLFIGPTPIRHILLPSLIAIPFVIIIPLKYPHVMSRFVNFLIALTPGVDPNSLSYHDLQFRQAMGSGGLLGMGFGEGLIKRSFLPASHTDSIFAVLVEEGGFITGFIVISLFMALFWIGERNARQLSDRFGANLARGITFYIVCQAMINICVCLGIMPNTGVTLPLCSYGGSSMITTLPAIGILINVSSQRNYII